MCYVLGTGVCTWGTPVYKQNRNPYSCRAYSLMRVNTSSSRII